MKLNLETKPIKVAVWILFVLYSALLVKVILLKPGVSITSEILSEAKLPLESIASHINVIPFKTILHYLTKCPSLVTAVYNLLGNIIAFSPMGFLLPLILNKFRKILSISIFSFIISLSFELIQLTAGIGEFDIDDIILNVLGTILGFVIYKVFIYLITKASSVNTAA